MRSRRLSLARERFSPLAAPDLGSVVGGSTLGPVGCDIHVARTFQFDCINDITFEWCPMPRTLPLEECL